MCKQEVNLWMSANSLKPNGDKTNLQFIGTPQQCLKVSNAIFNVADNSIGLCEKGKNLGVLIDKHLNLKPHITMVCKSASHHLHNTSLAKRYLTKDPTEKAMQEFAISRVDSSGFKMLLQGF